MRVCERERRERERELGRGPKSKVLSFQVFRPKVINMQSSLPKITAHVSIISGKSETYRTPLHSYFILSVFLSPTPFSALFLTLTCSMLYGSATLRNRAGVSAGVSM